MGTGSSALNILPMRFAENELHCFNTHIEAARVPPEAGYLCVLSHQQNEIFEMFLLENFILPSSINQ